MNKTTKPDLEKILVNAVLHAGAHLRAQAFAVHDLEWKKQDDPVTDLDKKTEQDLKERLGSQIPANFIGEEGGLEDNGARYTFIIDPIDGTKAYMRQDFLCAVSVAIEEDNELIGGIVYDFMRDIAYVGFRGNLYRQHAGKTVPFDAPYEDSKTRVVMEKKNIPNNIFQDDPSISVSSRLGSIALSMAHLASGAYDVMMTPEKTNSNAWDVAAGFYLIQANGLKVTDRDGQPFDYRKPTKGMIAHHDRATRYIAGYLDS